MFPTLKTLRYPTVFALLFPPAAFGLAALSQDERWISRALRSAKPALVKLRDTFNVQPSQALALPIIFANVGVFLAWKRAASTGFGGGGTFLDRWFCNAPYNRRALTLLLSTFSHKTGLHIGFNMLALWSLLPALIGPLGEFSLPLWLCLCI